MNTTPRLAPKIWAFTKKQQTKSIFWKTNTRGAGIRHSRSNAVVLIHTGKDSFTSRHMEFCYNLGFQQKHIKFYRKYRRLAISINLLQADKKSCMTSTVYRDLTFLHQEKLGMNVAKFTHIEHNIKGSLLSRLLPVISIRA